MIVVTSSEMTGTGLLFCLPNSPANRDFNCFLGRVKGEGGREERGGLGGK